MKAAPNICENQLGEKVEN